MAGPFDATVKDLLDAFAADWVPGLRRASQEEWQNVCSASSAASTVILAEPGPSTKSCSIRCTRERGRDRPDP
jgi:hypothetical protein